MSCGTHQVVHSQSSGSSVECAWHKNHKENSFGTVTAAMGHSKNLILVFVTMVLTAVLLRRLLGVYGLTVPLLYMFFDVNWSLRVTWIVLKKVVFSRGSNHNFLDVSESTFIVLPSDMDLNLHMNNAR